MTLKVKRLGDFAFFDTSPLTQFSKFYKILWECWSLCKNLSKFVPPVWKLNNPYCHNDWALYLLAYLWIFNRLRIRSAIKMSSLRGCVAKAKVRAFVTMLKTWPLNARQRTTRTFAQCRLGQKFKPNIIFEHIKVN